MKISYIYKHYNQLIQSAWYINDTVFVLIRCDKLNKWQDWLPKRDEYGFIRIIGNNLTLVCSLFETMPHTSLYQQYIRADVWHVLSLQFFVFTFNEENKGTHLTFYCTPVKIIVFATFTRNKSEKRNGNQTCHLNCVRFHWFCAQKQETFI